MRKAMMLVGLLVAAGCGSDSFEPSVPGGTPLNQLSAQQATTLCTEAENYTRAALPPETVTEYNCRSAGVETAMLLKGTPSDAETRTACKLGYDVCKRNPPAVAPSQPVAQVCANAMAEFVTCPAPVDQYAGCVNDSLSWLAANLPPCDRMTTLQVLLIATDEIAPPRSCELLALTCAGLASDEVMMSSSSLRLKKH